MSILVSVLKDIFRSRKNGGPLPAATGRDITASINLALESLNAGNFVKANEICSQLVSEFPGDENVGNLQHQIFCEMVQNRLPGPMYLEWLQWFHQKLKPVNYVEIGVESGRSLTYAVPPTVAIGIDPGIQVVHSQETWVKLFKLPSDDFFNRHNLSGVLGADSVDFSFIDGLHTFDQALKDFINIERYSSAKTVVLFHDIIPVVPVTAKRERETRLWVGDTWKALQVLLKYRPDLKIFTIPTYPSGLGVVTNLDASSRVLDRDFVNIYREAMAYEIDAYLPAINQLADATPNDFNAVSRILDANSNSAK